MPARGAQTIHNSGDCAAVTALCVATRCVTAPSVAAPSVAGFELLFRRAALAVVVEQVLYRPVDVVELWLRVRKAGDE